MVVTDASLGNVRQDGSQGEEPLEPVFSQPAYMVFLGEKKLINGQTGKFAMIDYIEVTALVAFCRSTYGAELLGAEEGFDVGQFVRALAAEFRGLQVLGKLGERLAKGVEMTVVTDAKRYL